MFATVSWLDPGLHVELNCQSYHTLHYQIRRDGERLATRKEESDELRQEVRNRKGTL